MTITHRDAAITGAADAVSPLVPAVPVGVTSTDLSLLTVQAKQNAAGTAPALTGGLTGWTQIGSAVNTGNNLAPANDVGTNYLWVYYLVGTYTAPSITTSGANSASASIAAYATTLATWDVSQSTTGVDNTSGVNGSITGAVNIGVATGDWLFCASAHPGDVGTMSAQTLAATGATLGATSVRENLGVTTGTDSRHMVVDAAATAGASSAAPTFTWTNASNLTGVAAFVRLRDVAAPSVFLPARPRVINSAALDAAYLW